MKQEIKRTFYEEVEHERRYEPEMSIEEIDEAMDQAWYHDLMFTLNSIMTAEQATLENPGVNILDTNYCRGRVAICRELKSKFIRTIRILKETRIKERKDNG